ncbi:MAG: PEP-utilizing enzyme [Parcubacteria group bacterium]
MSGKLLLKGIPASQGVAKGKVKVIRGIQDADKFNRGDILVTKITDPTMVAMIARAGAIICDIGGIVSHPSIVSRELGIPCVVNTKEATKRLKDGMMAKVDGKKGTILIINQDESE